MISRGGGAGGRRRRVSRVVVALALLPLALGGCGAAAAVDRSGVGERVVIVVSGTSAEPAPALPGSAAALLADTAASDDTTDGPQGRGSAAVVVSADGEQRDTLPLTPRRPDGRVEYGFERDNLIADNVTAVTQTVASVAHDEPRLDLLDRGIETGVRGVDGGTLMVVSNGLSTTGALDMAKLGWFADPNVAARQLADGGSLPDLTGFDVLFVGLGETAGAQPPLPKPIRDKLVAYWTAICTEAGAQSCTVDETPIEPGPPRGTVAQPSVPVPGVGSITGPEGTKTTVTDDVLGFAGDRWDLSRDGRETLDHIADQIRDELSKDPDRVVTVTGYTADPADYTPQELSGLARARAATVADVLRAEGIRTVRPVGAGPAPGMTAMVRGVFDESIGARMRRVEITY